MDLKQFQKEFKKLKLRFPFENRTAINVEDCDYCDQIFDSKRCYWTFNSAEMLDCLYCDDGFQSVNDVDCLWNFRTERNYECNDNADCSDCYFSMLLFRCYNVWFSYGLTDCHDCFGCSHLSRKSYCIENVQYTKKEYEEKLPKLIKMKPEDTLVKLERLKLRLPTLVATYNDSVNSDYCNYIYFVKNLYYCFDCSNSQDCGYMDSTHFSRDAWDTVYGTNIEQSAEISYADKCYNCYGIQESGRCYDSFFLYKCVDCHDCFGCVNLAHKEYCILNVQYTKKEYFEKLEQTKKELGIYFVEPKNSIEENSKGGV